MPGPYYIDSEIGNDSNDGLSKTDQGGGVGPKEHLSAVLDLITNLIESEIVINVAHDNGSGPNVYTETEDVLELRGIRCEGEDARLIIQATDWDNDKYEGGEDNPIGAGDWDPTTDHNMAIQYGLEITEAETFNLELRGLCLYGDDSVEKGGLKIEGSTGVIKTKYCEFAGLQGGIQLLGHNNLSIENCYFLKNGIGIIAMLNSTVLLYGDNYIEDPVLMGAYALINSNLVIVPWDEQPFDKFTLEVRTTKPRKKEFAALKAAINSTITIQDDSWHPSLSTVSAVKVINDCRFLNPEYYGVVLESKSLLTGAANMGFATLNMKGDQIEMPEANRIMAESEFGAVVVE